MLRITDSISIVTISPNESTVMLCSTSPQDFIKSISGYAVTIVNSIPIGIFT